MNSKTYDTLKFISAIIAPISVFIASLTEIWGLPYGAQIAATMAALDALFGAIVVIASNRYKQKHPELMELYAKFDNEE